jgi:hypothetical protein
MSNISDQLPVTPEVLEQLAEELDATMPDLLGEVRDLLAVEWPEYAQFLDEHNPDIAEVGVLFVHRLLDLAECGPPENNRPEEGEDARTQLVFEQIGRQQFQDGGDLSELLGAYQVGARAAWHKVSETALKLDLGSEALAALAEAVFAFVDEFSNASAHGYVLEQSASSAARERHREELAELLLSGRSNAAGIRAAVQHAGWQLPSEVSVVLADAGDSDACAVIDHLGINSLPIRRPDFVGAIVPNPAADGHASRLSASFRGYEVVVGHPITPDLLPAGLRIARTALRLHRSGLLAGRPILLGEQFDTLIANGDEWLLSLLRDQVLQPLRDIPDRKRERLIETLRSWLWNMGNRQAMAEELNVHPQTVRYRLDRLRELFGDRIDSPRERARLFLALVWDIPHEPHR